MKLRGTKVQYGFFIAQKLLFANQYVRKIHRISKFSKNFKIIKFKTKNLKVNFFLNLKT
jgi:hypothetical protein